MEKTSKNEDTGITLFDLARVIWKNIILIAGITVAVTVACIIYVFGVVKPTYKATTEVIVAVDSAQYHDTADYANGLRVVPAVGNDMVYSDYVIDTVQANHTELSKDEIRKNITTNATTQSYVVTISYVDTDAERAVAIANELSVALKTYVESNEAIQVFKMKLSVMNEATKADYNSPNKKLYVIVAVIGGLVLSLVIVFFKEFMSTKFKTKEEIENILNKDVIGLLPDSGKTKTPDELVPAPKTIQEFEPFNRLLSAIEYYNIENPYKSIMFTSTGEDELKTTTIFKLSHTIIYNEKKVIVIDLDIRKPVIHKYFKVQKKDGLVDYLKGSLSKEQIIKHSDVGVDVITAGENIINPIIILKNNKLKDLINELKEDYDFVLIDTPPATGLTDSVLIGQYVDGVVYNIALNQAKKKPAKEALKTLETAGAKIIGVNITKAKFSKSNYYYQYYYNYHYGETETKEEKASE